MNRPEGASPRAMTRHWFWAAPLSAVVIVLDQITKSMVLSEPTFRALDCLTGGICGRIEISTLFDLSMTWNRGVSFGAFQAEGWARWGLFAVTSAIALGFSVWLLGAARRLTALALCLVIGGAVGNLIDRARFGAVVDFLDFSGMYFPWVFNVADASITIGGACLLLDQLLAGRAVKG